MGNDHEDYLPGEAPAAHHGSHEDLGSDEINVDGLSGELADNQPCIAHDLGGDKHVADSLADLNTKVSDATLDDSGDPRTPSAHKVSHQDCGTDEISIAGLAGESAELAAHKILPTVHQDAPGLIETHRLVAGAHHAKYTDVEAVAALYAAKPCFIAHLTVTQADVTGDNTSYDITGAIWTEIKDQGSCFLNGTFTAPSTGVYLFSGVIAVSGLLAAHNYAYAILRTSNRDYYVFAANPGAIAGAGELFCPFSFHCDLDEDDTAYLLIRVYSGTKVVDVTLSTFFTGSRVI